jgi:hypothetical protein
MRARSFSMDSGAPPTASWGLYLFYVPAGHYVYAGLS